MSYEINIRVECTTCPAKFEGWVEVEVTGQSNYVRLKEAVPPNWGRKVFEGSGNPEPVCPKCKNR